MGQGGFYYLRALGKKSLRRQIKWQQIRSWYSESSTMSTILGLTFLEEMLYAMGGYDRLLPYAKEYSKLY